MVEAEPDLAGMPLPPGEDVAIGRFVSGRMGQAVVDRLVEPLLAGVMPAMPTSCRCGRPSPRWLSPRLRTVPHLGGGIGRADSGPPTLFAGIRGGWAGCRRPRRASGAEVRTGVTVGGLARTSYGWRIETGPAARPEAVPTPTR